ncbi:MAG: hypothetical protein A2580_00995 [Hydrogenophilales bacterium RIFOXYD1_FULL_62_11]|nr:MAG: hypothetical protein A2580_00995 [Hydrogenophilales bacterium RIFOXYD1_FULL_62_11]
MHRRVLELRGQKLSQAQVGKQLGLSRGRVCNVERVARKAKPTWLTWVDRGGISFKHIEAVLTLVEPKADALLREAMAKRWSAATLREHVQVVKGKREPGEPNANPDLAWLESKLAEHFSTTVQIVGDRSGGGGELRLRYSDSETFEGLLERMGVSLV